MGSCAAPSAKGDDKFITTDYLQQCPTTNALSPDGIDATNSLIGNDDYNCLIEGNKNNKRTATGLSTSIVGAAETRPRNISFNYIVRAA
ncbi:phage tail protein [Salmonella enterica]|uniref:phage tail protein n=1 Tax=Salmonella enterica TaxID=28901 RepID=UPI002E0EC474